MDANELHRMLARIEIRFGLFVFVVYHQTSTNPPVALFVDFVECRRRKFGNGCIALHECRLIFL